MKQGIKHTDLPWVCNTKSAHRPGLVVNPSINQVICEFENPADADFVVLMTENYHELIRVCKRLMQQTINQTCIDEAAALINKIESKQTN